MSRPSRSEYGQVPALDHDGDALRNEDPWDTDSTIDQPRGHTKGFEEAQPGAGETSGPVSLDEPAFRLSAVEGVTNGHANLNTTPPELKKKSVRTTARWRDLPRKDQLLVITLARLSEPLVQTSLQSYMFYQLKWFDPTLPDATISSQAGILHASFTAAQFITALIWGRLADSPRFGRKTVLLIGLGGTCISSIGFAFSTTFASALTFRLLGGVTNGNVGVMRTMISEIIREKKYQSRAFLMLPMTFNIGIIVGPILGGLLSDPAGSYPDLFGEVEFFKKYPYATPNLISAGFLFIAALSIWFCLEETLDSLRDRDPDIGSRIGKILASGIRSMWNRIRGHRNTDGYQALGEHPHHRHARNQSSLTDLDLDTDHDDPLPSNESVSGKKRAHGPRYTQRLPFRRLLTPNVLMTFASHFLLAFHLGTFNSLWFVFLSTPVYDPATAPPSHAPSLPFHFTGGLGLPPPLVGTAMAVLGVIGIMMQLFLYPRLSARLGTVRSFRLFVLCFPLAYTFVPYLSVVPSSASSPPPAAKSGFAVWAAITAVLFFQVSGRTFALPGQTILINNCTPHPSVLGTIHGLGQSVSSAARTIGPVMSGWLYGIGLSNGVVGGIWWALAGVAVLGVVASWFVREGDGHEIWLEGDEVEEGGEDGHATGDDEEGQGRARPGA